MREMQHKVQSEVPPGPTRAAERLRRQRQAPVPVPSVRPNLQPQRQPAGPPARPRRPGLQEAHLHLRDLRQGVPRNYSAADPHAHAHRLVRFPHSMLLRIRNTPHETPYVRQTWKYSRGLFSNVARASHPNWLSSVAINPYQPKVFGVKFSLREIGRVFSIKIRNFEL